MIVGLEIIIELGWEEKLKTELISILLFTTRRVRSEVATKLLCM